MNHLFEIIHDKRILNIDRRMKSKIKFTANLFIDIWIQKYGEKSAQEFSQFLKNYNKSGYSIQFYEDYQKRWRREVEKSGDYDLENFNFIFESFFPILKGDAMMDMMSMDFTLKKKSNVSKNKKNNELKMNHMKRDHSKEYNISFNRRDEKIYIKLNDKGVEYCWGPSEDFDILLSKLNIKNDEEVLKLLKSQKSYLLKRKEDITRFEELLNRILIKTEGIIYLTENFRIDELSDKELYLQLEEMKNQIKKNKKYNFNLKLYELLYKYIYNYIYQFIHFELNDYDKLKKIKCMYESYLFNKKNNLFNYQTFYPYGKKNIDLYITGESYIIYSIDVIKLFEKLTMMYMYDIFTEKDLILSLFLHQYDSDSLIDKKKEYMISDIYLYWKEKEKVDLFIKESNGNKVFYERRNLITKNGLFLEDMNSMNFPTNDILGGLWEERKNVYQKILKETMWKMSLDGTWRDRKDRMIYHKKLIINQNKKIKVPDYYYDISENLYLNPNQKGNTKYAYCSLYYGNNQYFLDTITFGYSLYMSGTTYDRILLVTRDIPEVQKVQLSRFYNRIITIKELDVDPKLFVNKNRWYGVFNKLYAFYLDEYEKIMITDTDMLIFNKGLDSLFEEVETPAGMCYRKELINTTNERIPEKWIDEERRENRGIISAGMLLIKPSKDVFFDMIMKIHPESKTNYVKVPSIFPEEGFLSDYFRKEWRTIPLKYSFTPLWLLKEDIFGVKSIVESIPKKDIVVIHYVGYKPWVYLENPIFIIFDNLNNTSKIMKYIYYWLNQYDELNEMMKKSTKNIEAFPVMFLRDFCNWDKISFKN
jgi:hypothetical protein